ncbi:beta-glucosidase [Haloechinothrix sp. LS1_15]|nr:GH1 family beta-glucosidase [Haloechinothrix sp. LS1_15]MDV6012486.1 beta-glucosidase [Haloechinothrix sp. LS1_15]
MEVPRLSSTEARPSGGTKPTFPSDFLWGAATSAYQIEGAAGEGGRSRSIWDVFSRIPGNVLDGTNGDVATDHYRRFRDDVALMARMGLGAYRFSVSWPRVQPEGRGHANPEGLDFYRRLVDTLLDHGIEPWPTLYHWDLPQQLEAAGGWPERDTAKRFADYVMLVHEAIGDRVRSWTTVNEPWCSAFLGYASGDHAPGRTEPAASVRAAHHLLLGHGLAVRRLRDAGAGRVGIILNLYPVSAASTSAADTDAARRVDGLHNRLFLDPVLRGRYPPDVVTDLAPVSTFDHVRGEDLPVIATPQDMLGINYYTRHTVAAPNGEGSARHGTREDRPPPYPGSEGVRLVRGSGSCTAMGWEIDASGLVDVLRRLHSDYPPVPLYVTENGAAFHDTEPHNGLVRDPERIDYLDAHLRACHAAITEGVRLRGYFVWSLLDNFEWSWGYTRRFGMVYVDYPTQRRIPKQSAHWYAGVIRHNGLPATEAH